MPDFKLLNGSTPVTPVEARWYGPRFFSPSGQAYLLSSYSTGSDPGQVTLVSAEIGADGSAVGQPQTIATYTIGTDKNGWREYETANNQRSVFWTSINYIEYVRLIAAVTSGLAD